jgi:hypothetical protein
VSLIVSQHNEVCPLRYGQQHLLCRAAAQRVIKRAAAMTKQHLELATVQPQRAGGALVAKTGWRLLHMLYHITLSRPCERALRAALGHSTLRCNCRLHSIRAFAVQVPRSTSLWRPLLPFLPAAPAAGRHGVHGCACGRRATGCGQQRQLIHPLSRSRHPPPHRNMGPSSCPE